MRMISLLAVCVLGLTGSGATACDYGLQSLQSYVPIQRVRVQHVYQQPVQAVEVDDYCVEPVVQVQRVRVQQVYVQPIRVQQVQQVHSYGVQAVQVQRVQNVHVQPVRVRAVQVQAVRVQNVAVHGQALNVQVQNGRGGLFGGFRASNRGNVVNVRVR